MERREGWKAWEGEKGRRQGKGKSIRQGKERREEGKEGRRVEGEEVERGGREEEWKGRKGRGVEGMGGGEGKKAQKLIKWPQT